jgi:hypothetical protein
MHNSEEIGIRKYEILSPFQKMTMRGNKILNCLQNLTAL